MSDGKPPRQPWGSGRVAFFARFDTIKSEMNQGYPLSAIHARHQDALGIGYDSFCKLVRKYAEDAKRTPPVRPRRDAPAPALSAIPTPPRAAPARPEGSNHVRHEPRPVRTFNYDGNPKEGDYERLIGPRKPKG